MSAEMRCPKCRSTAVAWAFHFGKVTEWWCHACGWLWWEIDS